MATLAEVVETLQGPPSISDLRFTRDSDEHAWNVAIALEAKETEPSADEETFLQTFTHHHVLGVWLARQLEIANQYLLSPDAGNQEIQAQLVAAKAQFVLLDEAMQPDNPKYKINQQYAQDGFNRISATYTDLVLHDDAAAFAATLEEQYQELIQSRQTCITLAEAIVLPTEE